NLLKLDAIDLTSHESQLVTVELLLRSDSIITMTNSHAEAILHSLPELSHCVRTLSPNGKDISDPIGGGPDEYARCKDEIVLYLETLLNSMPV
ncbi:MAG: hypothetical protein KDA58_17340, partial [Planctomycetaceae bacterium]|nr:hypothetical protein [Planctomycetaceae bacterium]